MTASPAELIDDNKEMERKNKKKEFLFFPSFLLLI